MAVVTGDLDTSVGQVGLVAAVAVAAQIGTTPARPLALRYSVLLAEAAAISLIVIASAPGDRPSIAYLAVPPILGAFALA